MSKLICLYTMYISFLILLHNNTLIASELFSYFSKPNILALNPTQSPEDLQKYLVSDKYNKHIFYNPFDNAFAAATISFKCQDGSIWLKALSLNPETMNTKSALTTVLQEIQTTLRKASSNKAPICCNITEHPNTKDFLETLRNLRWQPTQKYLTLKQQLTQSLLCDTDNSMIAINQATSEHIPEITTIFEHPEVQPWLNCSSTDIQTYLTNTRMYATIIALREKSTIIGAAVFNAIPAEDNYVHLLAVHPTYQHQGAATTLLKYIAQHCQKQGGISVHINTLSDNERALDCYIKNGFNVASILQRLLKIPTPGLSPQRSPQPEETIDMDHHTATQDPFLLPPTMHYSPLSSDPRIKQRSRRSSPHVGDDRLVLHPLERQPIVCPHLTNQ